MTARVGWRSSVAFVTVVVVQRWASTLLACYGGSILLGSLLFGWVGDQTKAKQVPFLLGMAVVGGATVLFSLTKTLSLVLLARLLQGLSTAIVFTIGFSLLLETVGSKHIGRAVGFTSMSLSLGLFGGPIIGGFVYDRAGYFAVFVPAFALIVLEIILRLLLRPRPPVRHDNDPDENEPLLPDTADTDTQPASAVTAPSILLRTPRFLVAMTGMCLLNTFMTAFEAVLPVYLRSTFHYSPNQIAIVFLSNTLPMVLSPLSGTIVDRIGPFWPAVAGFAVAGPSMMLLALVQHNSPTSSLLLLRAFLFLFGCGVSMAMPAVMAEMSMATEAVEARHPGIFGRYGAYSQTYGLSNAAFAGGTLAGPLLGGYISELAGWGVMVAVLGGLSLGMVVLVVVFTGREAVLVTGDES
ncbi:major facilitator superfamily domain-containing protein [Aspergillus candidus]|uniref:Major facilitator superfamily domain-containing protein n=1 Tax=Aspergillus candidus TaxID=41067 RepID=A0A2I2F2V5_ASPCN|nr:major facilitator superfamily domain-containing protein [Aspergillus candidus]PLB34938.1 major facilitator superfamily domain-containing protein [Aspergillus candidus]